MYVCVEWNDHDTLQSKGYRQYRMCGECSKGGYDTPHPDVKLWRPGDSIASTVYICHQVVSSPWCVCDHCCCCHCLN